MNESIDVLTGCCNPSLCCCWWGRPLLWAGNDDSSNVALTLSYDAFVRSIAPDLNPARSVSEQLRNEYVQV